MASIVIIDDDLAMDFLRDSFRFRGHEADRIPSAADALREIDRVVKADIVVLDIIMAWPEGIASRSLAGPGAAGMEVLREIRDRNKTLPVIAYSATQDAIVINALKDDPNSRFVSKWESHAFREVIHHVNNALGLLDEHYAPQPFIVHGHDEETKLALKNYLQNTLHLPEPIILHEKPNLGRTIIEKFEDFSAFPSLVFILLTPDDKGASIEETDNMKRRARQNVIFEMGYFLGLLGRKSGCVLLLHHGPLEIPSDLSGIVYIDVSNGIEAAGEQIRKEVEHARIERVYRAVEKQIA